MKKLISLIKACMTSDMNIFTIRTKKDKKSKGSSLAIILGFFFMFAIWSNSNILFEKMAPMHLQPIVLALVVFGTSIMVLIEGIYKTGPLIFNCKDDQLLLSLPIKRRTVLFVRVFKFYVFELAFNALFIIPLVIAYSKWAENLNWTFYLTSLIMIFILPIIPIILSCIIGALTSGISSRFKYKNATQIISSMVILLGVLYISMNLDRIFEYVANHASSVNDLITKIYYPAGLYASLATNFNLTSLLVFVLVNIVLYIISIYILSLFYFKINSRLKNVDSSTHVNVDKLKIKSNTKNQSLIKKELYTFFKTPVFIVNAGFGMVLYIVMAIAVSLKLDTFIDAFTLAFDKKIILNNLSMIVFLLIAFTAFMTSITNSVISLEGKNINILKSLPVKTKTILISKVLSSLLLTTPVLLIGDIILFVRLEISIVECILLVVLSILLPLASHFIGIIVNLIYPKLDAENSAEVVKQSTSSFLSVMIGMLLLIGTFACTLGMIGKMDSVILLLIISGIFILVDFILYLILVKYGVKKYNKLSV